MLSKLKSFALSVNKTSKFGNWYLITSGISEQRFAALNKSKAADIKRAIKRNFATHKLNSGGGVIKL